MIKVNSGFVLILASFFLFNPFVHAALQTPTSVKLKFYEVWVSTSALCTSPVRIFAPEVPAYQNIGAGSTPVLGTGTVRPGTYNCVILVFSDMIKSVASATQGNCISATEYTKGVCKTGDTSTNVDGTSHSCTTAGDDIMTVYFSTASATGGNQNSLSPPTTTTNDPNGENLATPLTVTSTGAGTAVFNVTNGLDGATSNCSLENLSFSFRN